MNLCNLIKNNKILYGLIIVILKTRLNLYPYGFTMWTDAIDSMIMTVDKYYTYSNKAYWRLQVVTGRDYKLYYFVKRITPSEHILYIWGLKGD